MRQTKREFLLACGAGVARPEEPPVRSLRPIPEFGSFWTQRMMQSLVQEYIELMYVSPLEARAAAAAMDAQNVPHEDRIIINVGQESV
jgi:hypothetical protein